MANAIVMPTRVRSDQRATHDPATAAVRRHALAVSYELLAEGVGRIQRRNQSSIAGLVDSHPLPRSPEFLLPGLPVEPNRETTLSEGTRTTLVWEGSTSVPRTVLPKHASGPSSNRVRDGGLEPGLPPRPTQQPHHA